MLHVVSVFLLAVIGLSHAGPLPAEPILKPQENFTIDRFMGKWYDLAVASTCSWSKSTRDRRRRVRTAIGTLELQFNSSAQTVRTTRSVLSDKTCKTSSCDYKLTEIPGRFYYHSEKLNADVDTNVVETDYDDYAVVVMDTYKQGNKADTYMKLYGRTMDMRINLLREFYSVAEFFDMQKNLEIKVNKGECVPGEQATSQPQIQRARRNVVVPPPEEGSGDDPPMFRGDESCKAAPDSGPCFEMLQRYHYNSSIMTCQIFTYGGCMGNQNNFMTEKECLKSCRTEVACRLPMDAGPCEAYTDLWAYDSSVGKCVSFKYGGCKGNGNKFYSQKECDEYCGVMMRQGEDEFLNVN